MRRFLFLKPWEIWTGRIWRLGPREGRLHEELALGLLLAVGVEGDSVVAGSHFVGVAWRDNPCAIPEAV